MFEREVDWKKATVLICDIMRGSAALEVQSHTSVASEGGRTAQSSSWRYEQTQAHQLTPYTTPRLFSLDHLRELLDQMSKAEIVYVYETSGGEQLRAEVEDALLEFAAIEVTVVKLAVGFEHLSWILISLHQPRDLILWKMKYHLRGNAL